VLERGGLYLTKADGEKVMAEMPASLLRAMQSLLAAVAESGTAFIFKPEDGVSPEPAAELLGVSRPIVYQRMDTGKIPFRQVGTHRRLRAADVARLKQFEDRRRSFAAALSADTEDLEENFAQPGRSVLDANVLYANHLRNLLLQLAQNDVFDARWSERIEQEWLGATEPRTREPIATRTIPLIRRWFADALVAGFDAECVIGATNSNDGHVAFAAAAKDVEGPAAPDGP